MLYHRKVNTIRFCVVLLENNVSHHPLMKLSICIHAFYKAQCHRLLLLLLLFRFVILIFNRFPISVDIPRGSAPSIPNQTWNLRSFVEPPEQRQRDLAVVGFTPSINSWEIVQLIKMITTQLLPAAGLLPFVFALSCEVKEVGESCRYVWLAVWISGIWYPEVLFFSLLPSQLRETEGGREILEKLFHWKKKKKKITLRHLIARRMVAANTSGVKFLLLSACLFPSYS